MSHHDPLLHSLTFSIRASGAEQLSPGITWLLTAAPDGGFSASERAALAAFTALEAGEEALAEALIARLDAPDPALASALRRHSVATGEEEGYGALPGQPRQASAAADDAALSAAFGPRLAAAFGFVLNPTADDTRLRAAGWDEAASLQLRAASAFLRDLWSALLSLRLAPAAPVAAAVPVSVSGGCV